MFYMKYANKAFFFNWFTKVFRDVKRKFRSKYYNRKKFPFLIL